MIKLKGLTQQGYEVEVEVDESAHEDLKRAILETQRRIGRAGITPISVPAEGFEFPFDNANDFDWSIIGARLWISPEGEQCVYFRGQRYKRRDHEADPKKNASRAVRFSRGAKETDPQKEYVTLASFRDGKRWDAYAIQPEHPQSTTPKSAPSKPAPAPRKIWCDMTKEEFDEVAKQLRIETKLDESACTDEQMARLREEVKRAASLAKGSLVPFDVLDRDKFTSSRAYQFNCALVMEIIHLNKATGEVFIAPRITYRQGIASRIGE